MIKIEKLCRDALHHYGHDLQILKGIEELGELTSVLIRQHFRKRTDTNSHDVCSEIADVLLFCETLKIIYGEDEVNNKIQEKAERVKAKIDGIIGE